MAAQDYQKSLLDETDEAYITCGICCYVYNDKERKPKYLTCHHYFCLSCTKGLVKDSATITCPLCRAKTKCDSGMIENLTTNTIVLRMLEKLQPQQIPLRVNHSELLPTTKLWCTICAQDAKFCTFGNHNLVNYEEFCFEMIECFHKSQSDLKHKCSRIAQKIEGNKEKLMAVLDGLEKIRDIVYSQLETCEIGLSSLELLLMDSEKLPQPSTSNVQACKEVVGNNGAELDKMKREAAALEHRVDSKIRSFQQMEKTQLNIQTVRSETNVNLPAIFQNLPLWFTSANALHYAPLLQGFIPVVSFCAMLLCSTPNPNQADDKSGKKSKKTKSEASNSSSVKKSSGATPGTSGSKNKASHSKTSSVPAKDERIFKFEDASLSKPVSKTLPKSFSVTEDPSVSPLGTLLHHVEVNRPAPDVPQRVSSRWSSPLGYGELLASLSPTGKPPLTTSNPVADACRSPAVGDLLQDQQDTPSTLSTPLILLPSTPGNQTTTPEPTTRDNAQYLYNSIDDEDYLTPRTLIPQVPPPVPARQGVKSTPTPAPRSRLPELPPRPTYANNESP